MQILISAISRPVDAYATPIDDPKTVSAVSSKLNKLYPLDVKWSHLKRINPPKHSGGNKFRFLIGPIDLVDRDELVANLNDSNLSTTVELVKVPESKPLTRKQAEFCKQHWSCNFYEFKQ